MLLIPGGDWQEIDPDHTRMATFAAIASGYSLVREPDLGLSILWRSTARAHQTFAALRNLLLSLIHLWRGSQVTAAREYYASHLNILFRQLQITPFRS